MSGTIESVRGIIRKNIERCAIRVYISAAQNDLIGNTWNKINLNARIYDLGGNFDTTAYKFTAPVTGLYHIIGSVSFSSLVIDKSYSVAVYKNGALLTKGASQAVVNDSLIVKVSDEVFLNKDDYIELYAYPSVGSGIDTVDVVVTSSETYLVIRLVSKEGTRQ